MYKRILSVVFWGSLWGITEASLGYLIHLSSLPVSGLIMFPAAFYFMKKAYNDDTRPSTIFYVSLIAALIKLTDVLIPGRILILVINPAIAILLEGLAVSLLVKYLSSSARSIAYMSTFGMGLLWRSLFLVDQYIISRYNLPAGLVTNGIYVSLKFLVWESFINSILIYAYLRIASSRNAFKIRPAFSFAALAMAVVLQRLV